MKTRTDTTIEIFTYHSPIGNLKITIKDQALI